ncbi:hypothetical protein BG61_02610 [Caballeronia glathei]|uniref:Uncharacterized protein n=1 Tax=Caballeronia glathei TaxID=60547 RepID=A0A069Q0D5_9BURK|nr:hypothetical protein BG61_02610 [Caballeronia glathei]
MLPSDADVPTANVCTQPIRSEAASAPPSEPSPPITTTTNTIGPIASAIDGSITKSGAPITPASAASAVPTPNTVVKTRGTSWPSVSTVAGWVSAARTTSPVFDTRRTAYSAASIAIESTIMNAR